jgi:hypothetical protein
MVHKKEARPLRFVGYTQDVFTNVARFILVGVTTVRNFLVSNGAPCTTRTYDLLISSVKELHCLNFSSALSL